MNKNENGKGRIFRKILFINFLTTLVIGITIGLTLSGLFPVLGSASFAFALGKIAITFSMIYISIFLTKRYLMELNDVEKDISKHKA